MQAVQHPGRRHALAALLALAAASAWAQPVVKIGYTGPLSGGAAQYGKNVLAGMEMAVKEINEEGLRVAGKAYKLELVALDDKYNPSEAAINAQRLVQQHRAPVILVPHAGGAFAMQTSNEQLKYVLMAFSTLPEITARGNGLTVRMPPDFNAFAPSFVRYTMARHGKNAALAAGDHDYAKAWAAVFKRHWEAAGGKVVAENPMSYNRDTDFYSGVSRVLAAKPDVLLLGGPSEPTGLVIKQARELGFKGGMALIDQVRLEEVIPIAGGYAALEGSIAVLPVSADSTPEARLFVERYRRMYPGQAREPGLDVSINYSAVHAAIAAMKLAGTVSDAAAIRGKFDAAVRMLRLPQNPYRFEGVASNGNFISDGRMAVIEGGKLKEVKRSELK
jgi:branched-chain amino acid transport system substrate-binding protein